MCFVFTIAAGSSWSILEGGFSQAMTPSGFSLYEVNLVKSGPFCIGYDQQRVVDWDLQTKTDLQGYSPNPSTFDTVEVLAEADAPFDVLPFNDSYADGECPPPPAPPCAELVDPIVTALEKGDLSTAASATWKLLECIVKQLALAEKKRVL